eukprot:gene10919-6890_t
MFETVEDYKKGLGGGGAANASASTGESSSSHAHAAGGGAAGGSSFLGGCCQNGWDLRAKCFPPSVPSLDKFHVQSLFWHQVDTPEALLKWKTCKNSVETAVELIENEKECTFTLETRRIGPHGGSYTFDATEPAGVAGPGEPAEVSAIKVNIILGEGGVSLSTVSFDIWTVAETREFCFENANNSELVQVGGDYINSCEFWSGAMPAHGRDLARGLEEFDGKVGDGSVQWYVGEPEFAVHILRRYGFPFAKKWIVFDAKCKKIVQLEAKVLESFSSFWTNIYHRDRLRELLENPELPYAFVATIDSIEVSFVRKGEKWTWANVATAAHIRSALEDDEEVMNYYHSVLATFPMSLSRIELTQLSVTAMKTIVWIREHLTAPDPNTTYVAGYPTTAVGTGGGGGKKKKKQGRGKGKGMPISKDQLKKKIAKRNEQKSAAPPKPKPTRTSKRMTYEEAMLQRKAEDDEIYARAETKRAFAAEKEKYLIAEHGGEDAASRGAQELTEQELYKLQQEEWMNPDRVVDFIDDDSEDESGGGPAEAPLPAPAPTAAPTPAPTTTTSTPAALNKFAIFVVEIGSGECPIIGNAPPHYALDPEAALTFVKKAFICVTKGQAEQIQALGLYELVYEIAEAVSGSEEDMDHVTAQERLEELSEKIGCSNDLEQFVREDACEGFLVDGDWVNDESLRDHLFEECDFSSITFPFGGIEEDTDMTECFADELLVLNGGVEEGAPDSDGGSGAAAATAGPVAEPGAAAVSSCALCQYVFDSYSQIWDYECGQCGERVCDNCCDEDPNDEDVHICHVCSPAASTSDGGEDIGNGGAGVGGAAAATLTIDEIELGQNVRRFEDGKTGTVTKKSAQRFAIDGGHCRQVPHCWCIVHAEAEAAVIADIVAGSATIYEQIVAEAAVEEMTVAAEALAITGGEASGYAPGHRKVRFTMEIWDEDGVECETQEFVMTVKEIAKYDFDLDNNCDAFYDGQEDSEGFDAWVEGRFMSKFEWTNTGDMNHLVQMLMDGRLEIADLLRIADGIDGADRDTLVRLLLPYIPALNCRFEKFLKLKNISQKTTNLTKTPGRDIERPHEYVAAPDAVHQADVLFLPNDDGYKYLLVVVDVATRLTDAYPMKFKNQQSVIAGFTKIYSRPLPPKKRKGNPLKERILSKPIAMQTDDGAEFTGKEPRQYFKDNGIALRVGKPGRSRQQAMVETRNGMINRFITARQNEEEGTTGEYATGWMEDIPLIVQLLNEDLGRSPPSAATVGDEPVCAKSEAWKAKGKGSKRAAKMPICDLLPEGTKSAAVTKFRIDRILGDKMGYFSSKKKKEKLYQVKWEDPTGEYKKAGIDISWQPAKEVIKDVPKLVQQYEDAVNNAKKGK